MIMLNYKTSKAEVSNLAKLLSYKVTKLPTCQFTKLLSWNPSFLGKLADGKDLWTKLHALAQSDRHTDIQLMYLAN